MAKTRKDIGEGAREARFRDIYTAHYPALYAYALRRSSDPAEAHDVVADTFLVLWRRFEEAPQVDDELRPWLFGVARRVFASHDRTQRRRDRLAQRLAETVAEGASLEEQASRRDDARRLFEALFELSDEERELLMLAAWERLPMTEIAQILGCSENAASIRLHRARKRLSVAYEKESTAISHDSHEGLRLRRPLRRRNTDE